MEQLSKKRNINELFSSKINSLFSPSSTLTKNKNAELFAKRDSRRRMLDEPMNRITSSTGYEKIDFNKKQRELLMKTTSNSSLEALDSLKAWGAKVEKPKYNRYSFPTSISSMLMSGARGSATPYDFGYLNQVNIASGDKEPLRVLTHELGHVQNNRYAVLKNRSLNEIYSELVSGMSLKRLAGITKEDYDNLMKEQKRILSKRKK
jgi:hypothetical protein